MRGLFSSKSNPGSPSAKSVKSSNKHGQEDLDNASTAIGASMTQRTTGLASELGGDDVASSLSGSAMTEDGFGSSNLMLGNSQRLSARHLNQPDDGHFLDSDFEEVCRATVAAERRRMVQATLRRAQDGRTDSVIGGESMYTSSPERLLNFFQTEGAIYAKYDLATPMGSGGPLPSPWTAVKSRTTGRTYYANTRTGETQWDPPLYPLSREWTMQNSPQSGAVFYVHKETGRWQWERPIDEQFLDLQEAGNSDKEALKIWRQRNERADYGFGGLEDHPGARAVLAALPAPPPTDDDSAGTPAAALEDAPPLAALPALEEA